MPGEKRSQAWGCWIGKIETVFGKQKKISLTWSDFRVGVLEKSAFANNFFVWLYFSVVKFRLFSSSLNPWSSLFQKSTAGRRVQLFSSPPFFSSLPRDRLSGTFWETQNREKGSGKWAPKEQKREASDQREKTAPFICKKGLIWISRKSGETNFFLSFCFFNVFIWFGPRKRRAQNCVQREGFSVEMEREATIERNARKRAGV